MWLWCALAQTRHAMQEGHADGVGELWFGRGNLGFDFFQSFHHVCIGGVLGLLLGLFLGLFLNNLLQLPQDDNTSVKAGLFGCSPVLCEFHGWSHGISRFSTKGSSILVLTTSWYSKILQDLSETHLQGWLHFPGRSGVHFAHGDRMVRKLWILHHFRPDHSARRACAATREQPGLATLTWRNLNLLCHSVSPCVTLCHPVSPCVTLCHPVSPCVRLFQRVQRRGMALQCETSHLGISPALQVPSGKIPCEVLWNEISNDSACVSNLKIFEVYGGCVWRCLKCLRLCLVIVSFVCPWRSRPFTISFRASQWSAWHLTFWSVSSKQGFPHLGRLGATPKQAKHGKHLNKISVKICQKSILFV